MHTVESLTSEFQASLEAYIAQQINDCFSGVLAVKTPTITKTGKARKKGPIQLCPVPRCQSRGAPAFAMMCRKHKDLPKKLVRKYRAARKAKKARA